MAALDDEYNHYLSRPHPIFITRAFNLFVLLLVNTQYSAHANLKSKNFSYTTHLILTTGSPVPESVPSSELCWFSDLSYGPHL